MIRLWALLVAAAGAGSCTYVLVMPHPRRRLLRRSIGGWSEHPAPRGPVFLRRLTAPTMTSVLVAVTSVAAAAAALRIGSTVLAALLPVVAAVLMRTRRARSRQLACERMQVAVVDLCAALAAELRAGSPMAAALERAAEVPSPGEPIVPRALLAVRSGGNVAQALRWDASTAGGEGLRALAACWEVALGSGAALSPALSRLAQGLRAEQAQRREVAASLAAPRATARLLAMLPAVGILMGTGLGVDPLGLLLGTPIGALLLASGVGLVLLGVVWTDRLARAADSVPPNGRPQ